MWNPRCLLAVAAIPLLIVACAEVAHMQESEKPTGMVLYVSTKGNDAWSGRLAEPNPAATDGPLATLEGARDRIRALRIQNAKSEIQNGIAVFVRDGMYELARTFTLAQEDSGTKTAPVVYRAYEKERPILIGGKRITGFSPYKGQILKADVNSQGLQGVYFRQLFFDGKRQHLARYPNYDPSNPYGGGWAYVEGAPVGMYQEIPGEDKHTLHFKAQDLRPWAHPEEGEVFIFPRYNWWNNIVPIQSLDREKRIATLAKDCSYAIRPNDRYYVRNLFEELDAPGEWYLDKQTGTLYFWPPSPIEGKAIYAPTLKTIIEIGPKTEHVTIRGLTIECCEGTAITLKDTVDCLIAGNTIRNVGDYTGHGVVVGGGLRNGVVGNDIYEVGGHGIAISGGDRKTLTPAENYADNNYIHHTGVFYKHGQGIDLRGVGNRVSHNLIHDGPRCAIGFMGNNLVIEYNHVRHVMLETADASALSTGGRDWISSRGTCLRYNYVHDVLGYDITGQHHTLTFGIYPDDNTGGLDIIGNIVARATAGPIFLHNARDTIVENNIFVDGPGAEYAQVTFSGWLVNGKRWQQHFPEMIKGYESVAGQPAWAAMRHMDLHPSQAPLSNGMTMRDNVFQRNIFYYSGDKTKLFHLRDVPLDYNKFDYNLVYHFGKPLTIDHSQPKAADVPGATPVTKDTPTDCWPQWWRAQGEDQHSIVADPMFVAPEKDDYRLRPDSPAFKLGFKAIPVEKIGPYADPLRASWPIVEAEGAREKPSAPPEK